MRTTEEFAEYFEKALTREEVEKYRQKGCLDSVRTLMACAWYDGRMALLKEQIRDRSETNRSALAELGV